MSEVMSATRPTTVPGTKCVLVVDDNPVDARLAGRLLEKSGMEVVYAADGFKALDLLQSKNVDVVLTDMLMPDMDGLELVDALRSDYPGIPAILMTGQGSEELAVQALQRGAAGYVPKKKLPHQLVDIVEQLIARLQVDRSQMRLQNCLVECTTLFQLDNDVSLVPPLVSRMQETAAGMGLCDMTGNIRLGVALEEALLNAIYHGNLEISSELKQDATDAFYKTVAERRRLALYRERRVHFQARFDRSAACFIVRDEGPGFDISKIPDPLDPANLERASGRGLLLIRAFMDEVHHNTTGNEITMIKRREVRPVDSKDKRRKSNGTDKK